MKKNLLIGILAALLICICCFCVLTRISQKNETEPERASVAFEDVLTTRRSVRSYDATKKISEAEVRELLTAVQEAPSWANTQTSRYYVAFSKEKADAVREYIGEWNRKNTEGAPVFIVSNFVKGRSGFGRPGNLWMKW